jgi:hypothetical protein
MNELLFASASPITFPGLAAEMMIVFGAVWIAPSPAE